jgi:hypothetical protein
VEDRGEAAESNAYHCRQQGSKEWVAREGPGEEEAAAVDEEEHHSGGIFFRRQPLNCFRGSKCHSKGKLLFEADSLKQKLVF